MRIFPKSQKELWDEGFDKETNTYIGAKWGKYIRAPQIFFKILAKCKDKLVPLKEVANVRRGFTTGANEFFYLTEAVIKHWKIEKEFWMHKENDKWMPNYVITSPQESKFVTVNPEDLKYRVLMIHKDKKALKGTNMLKYIEWGERKKFNTRSTCDNRGFWYDLNDREPGTILIAMIQAYRHIVFCNPKRLYPDHNLFEIITDKKDSVLIMAFLSSAITMLTKEIYGRSYGGGSGPLKTEGIDIARFLVAKPSCVTAKQKENILEKFRGFSKQPLGNTFVEIGTDSPDEVSLDKVTLIRRELDKIIMGDILGLTDEEQLDVYKAVVDMVKSRIDKAKSFGKKGKTKDGVDIQRVLEELDTETDKEKI
ncbi:MAG: hypothetical protein AAB019_10250 [Planctomycetota bacterium]